jgi:uncharacterized caspase-like protein
MLSRRAALGGIAAAALAPSALAAGDTTGRRLALLIGNTSYKAAIGTLRNPGNDVALVQRVLAASGVAQGDMLVLNDATDSHMSDAIAAHMARVAQAGPDAISLFYYAGHGASDAASGRGYLVPSSAASTKSDRLWQESMSLDTVLDQLSGHKGVSVVMLDCCRNELALPPTPAASSTVMAAADTSRGFTAVRRQRRPNMFLSHATWEGQTASDGAAGAANGPYATAFADAVKATGKKDSLLDLFDDVRLRVLDATGDAQEPMNLSRLSAGAADLKPFAAAATGGTRMPGLRPRALVIGNTYASKPGMTLPIARPDAESVSAALANAGFAVDTQHDLGKAQFDAQLEKFAASLQGTACMVYLTGYAFGRNGANYFLPDNARVADGLPVLGIINRLLASKAKAVFIALDCARPFEGSPGARSVEQEVEAIGELASMGRNVVIAYAAGAGQWAAKPRERSPFAAAFADAVQKPERRSLQSIAGFVRADVLKATGGTQRPWFQSANGVPIYFRDSRGLVDG